MNVWTELALKSSIVLASAWIIAVFLSGRSAAVRHLVWTAASAAVLVLPFLSMSLPRLRVPVPSLTGPASFQVVASGKAGVDRSSMAGVPDLRATPVRSGSRMNWIVIGLGIWVAGAVLALLRMLGAWLAIGRLCRSSKPFSDPGLGGALLSRLGLRGSVPILETRPGSMPMTVGILRPSILLPADAAHWSEERRQVVLLHELAHVRRGDVATHVLARLALILNWWNPLAWIAWREVIKERERAADDLVLNAGTPATNYAQHLLDVARGMQLEPATAWAGVAMVRRSQLEVRLGAILSAGINRAPAGRTPVVVTVLAALALIAPLAALRAQEVKTIAVPADVQATIQAARSQKNYQILEDSATAAVEARQFETAAKLLDAALAIRGDVAGIDSREYGLGLLKVAALQQRRHETTAADASYAKAAAILGKDPSAGPALLHLGTSALIKKQYAEATDYFERAQRIDPLVAGLALMWSAVSMDQQHNTEEAGQLFQRAVAQQDPASPEAGTILLVYSHFLDSIGKADEAAATAARAHAVEPSKSATLPDGVYRIGGAVQAPKVLEKKEPEYTEEARAAKLTGTEVLSVEIGPDGLAHNIQVLRGLGLGLDENGVDAISQWRFQPGMKDGQPVTVLATIEINFRLF